MENPLFWIIFSSQGMIRFFLYNTNYHYHSLYKISNIN